MGIKSDRMLDVDQILQLHEAKVLLWHQQNVVNDQVDDPLIPLAIICQQHLYNFELWHQEDIARSPEATDSQIAQVKRNIDRLNQARNDHIEKIDDWITEVLKRESIQLKHNAWHNTETAGSVIDRLSILSLRIYHYREQCDREDASTEHRERTLGRWSVCLEQRKDLSNSLRALLRDLFDGSAVHKTYRQFKMYNDPSLNPFLYKKPSANS